MVPMHGRNAEGAFHEPPFRPPRRSRPRPRLGGLSSRTSTRTSRFMVPMHGRNAEGAFHEPPVRSPGFSRYGPPEGGTPNNWRPTERFMVPMHGIKVVGALHDDTHHPPPTAPGPHVDHRVRLVLHRGGLRERNPPAA